MATKLSTLCESIRLKIQRGASIEEIMEDIKNASLTPEGRLAIHCEIIRLKEERGTPAEELSDDIKKVCRHLLSYLPDTPKNSFRREFAKGVIEAFNEFEFRKSDVGQRFLNEIANPIARIKFLMLKLLGRVISNPKVDFDVRGYFLVKHKKDVHDLSLFEMAELLECDYNQVGSDKYEKEAARTSAILTGTNAEQAEPTPSQAIDKQDLAIALLFKCPELSLPEIAIKVGVDRTTLYKWPKFLEAAEAADKYSPKAKGRGGLPRGSKSADGRMEAWDDS